MKTIKLSKGAVTVVDDEDFAGKSSHVDVYVSPAGRSVRVFGKSNGEWKPSNLSASCIPGDHK